jgi:hypothetical protein
VKRTSLLIFVEFCILGPAAHAQQQSITLPAGTEIAISTIDRIASKNADLKREYAASLDDPVIVDGVTVVPAKANAFLRVTDVKNPKFKRASLAISLVAVTVNGQRVEVNTDHVDSQSGSKAKRTAVGAAVGAGTGAAIGAAVGGGVGAGIGAAVGGLTGGGVGVLTAKGVEIAPETRFTYKLTQPVVINSQQAAVPQAGPQTAIASTQPPTDAAPPPIVPPASPPDAQHALRPPELIGAVYFQNDSGALTPLERNRAIERRGRATPQESYWEMDGARSPVRFKSGQTMLFVVQLANGIDPGTYALLPLDTRTDIRRTKSEPRNKTAPLSLLVNVIKVGDSTYGLTPVRDLAPGEYAFSPTNSNNAYCFGVDP